MSDSVSSGYILKPRRVEAVRTSHENLERVQEWLGAHSRTLYGTRGGYRVRFYKNAEFEVAETDVFIGDWIYLDTDGQHHISSIEEFREKFEPEFLVKHRENKEQNWPAYDH